MSKIARLRLAAIASENISCIAPLYYTAQSLTAYSLTVYSCYCHIVFVTIHLSHCICHIAFVTLHMSHCICHYAFCQKHTFELDLTNRPTDGHCLGYFAYFGSPIFKIQSVTG